MTTTDRDAEVARLRARLLETQLAEANRQADWWARRSERLYAALEAARDALLPERGEASAPGAGSGSIVADGDAPDRQPPSSAGTRGNRWTRGRAAPRGHGVQRKAPTPRVGPSG